MCFCLRVVDVGPPKKPVRRTNADGSLSLVQRLLLYDFLEVSEYICFKLDDYRIDYSTYYEPVCSYMIFSFMSIPVFVNIYDKMKKNLCVN